MIEPVSGNTSEQPGTPPQPTPTLLSEKLESAVIEATARDHYVGRVMPTQDIFNPPKGVEQK